MRQFYVISPRLFGFLVLICIHFTSCEKVDSLPADFRDAYIGKYQVHEAVRSYGFIECGEPYYKERDTVILVSYGNTDSDLV